MSWYRYRLRGWLSLGQGTCCFRLVLLHEVAHQLSDLIRLGVEPKMSGLEYMDVCVGHVPPICLRLGQLEGLVVLAPDDQKPGLVLLHPGLPPGISVDVGAVIVEEIALDLCLPRLSEESVFIGPEIGIVALHVGIVADVAGSGCRQ